ncbi:extracellular solute-binding protein [Desertihabitans brevis]|uniref:Extracellular solute-binding protein n=1 Tax=Desertihabitans brevis TaxID=2268447 RepID=A0A367YT90_9ACTN|nr:extracellular solute-binding protein [Desertihabitans brevis]RCK69106.1 extracellular solute-binding protein [Desertihabitans brevis]
MTRLKTMAASATAVLLAASLVACSGDGGGEEAVELGDKQRGAMTDYAVGTQFTATEPLTFAMLYNDHPNYPIKEDWLLWQEITERTGVTLEPTVVPLSDYSQKRSLLIGSGEAPLIMAKTYPGEETPFVSSGAILPVSDYLDLMPNFQAKVAEWGLEPNLEQLRQADGKFYVLPGLHENPWQDYTVAIRTDVMEDLGLETPQTWEDFRDVLRAIKAEHPDGYPMSDRFSETDPGGNLLNIVSMTYGTHAGWGYQNAQWDADQNAYVTTGTSPEYKEFVTFMHSLVEEGLLDPESFTQDDDTAISKFVSGKSYAISSNAQSLVNDYRGPLQDNVEGATVAKLPLPAGPAGNVISSGSKIENGIMISAAAAERDDFVAMMQFIDWLWYSPEGLELTKWGVEGVTYTKQGEGEYTLAEDVDYVGLNPGAPKHLQKDFGFAGGNFAYGGSTALLQSTFSEEELAFQAEMLKKDLLPLEPPYPFTDVEREQATLVETPLEDFVTQQTLQFILGQRDLAEWDAYVAEVEAKGAGQYLQLVNEAQQRFAEGNG